MTNLNSVVIEGRLIRDASEGYRKSGETAFGSFSIAVSRSSKSKDSGEWKDEVSYIECKGFGKRYDYAVPKMTKGTTVSLVGKLVQERWVSKDGQNKSRVVVEVDEYHVQKREAPAQGQSEKKYDPNEFWNKPEQGTGFQEDIPF